MNAEAARSCLARIALDPERLRGYLHLMFIAGHLERIGDHARNIGEEAVCNAVAEDIRHQAFIPE
ncbi:MAG TPA: PhoU domain-containing protein [Chthoniobacterales bacterium]